VWGGGHGGAFMAKQEFELELAPFKTNYPRFFFKSVLPALYGSNFVAV
jgi:hypothetical protein